MLLLEGLRYSPWTEKARWALDHHEIPYLYREHVMMLGMPRLRLQMRRPVGPITVPVLLKSPGDWIMDSLQIAEWADGQGMQEKLFFDAARPSIVEWNDRSEDATDAARAVALVRIAESPEAQKAALPPFIPTSLKGAMAGATRLAVEYVAHEFRSRSRSIDQHRERVRAFALGLQKKLAGRPYLMERFTFADVIAASTLNVIEPVREKYLRLPEAIREVWTDPELAREFWDLLEWRDGIYAAHRKPRARVLT
jgi:glutathione S-transferase